MKYAIALTREEVVHLYQTPLSTLDVAKLFGVSAEMIRKKLVEWGVPRHPPKNLPRPQPNKARKMEANRFWKGGRTVDRKGYVLVKRNDHPGANASGYVRLHRLVMEETLGRPLLAGEVVHHVDEDPSNNEPGNLRLYASNAEHLADTLKTRCPAWTEEGKQKMQQNGQRLGQKHAASLAALKAYALALNETPDRFLASLSVEQRHLCGMASELGILWPLAELELERETIRREWLVLQSPRSRRRWGRKWGYQH